MGEVISFKDQLQAARAQINLIVAQIALRVMSLPDNENISRMGTGGNIFIMSSKHLGDSWSPLYYDFKYQYRFISDELIRCEDPIAKLENAIKTGEILGSTPVVPGKEGVDVSAHKGTRTTLRLHPEVVNHLKELHKKYI